MKKIFGLMVVMLIVAFASVVSATIINNTAPTWRGQANTTYQAWGFNTNANPAALESGWNNIYGTPALAISGVGPITTFWKNLDNTHQGVWRIDNHSGGYISIVLPNVPVGNPQKTVQLQMTYYASGSIGADPEIIVTTSPDYTNLTLNQISKVQLDGYYYYHAIWEIVIEPNPNEETLYLMPRDCTLYIDEIVVDTICPEPATIAILSLGGLLLRRRK